MDQDSTQTVDPSADPATTDPATTEAPDAGGIGVRRRRWGRIVGRLLVVVLVNSGAGVGAAEAYVDSVPLPGDPPAPQASVLYYRDGHTILARVGVADHSDVPLSAVPLDVRHAVLAAEDRDFYQHAGVSARGVLRAVVADTGGARRQGASTITQQYARNAHLTQTVSLERKAKEVALAIKLERQYSKDEILARYLNTIYFGRGAYGIAAAAHAYFGISPERLTFGQGAVLAAVIKDPWRLDPANNAREAKARWTWIAAAAVQQGWVNPRSAVATAYPVVLPPSAGTADLAGPNGLVVDQVEHELQAHGISPQTLHTRGLSVVTTLDPTAQRAALRLVGATLRPGPKKLRAALVAVDPASGAVRAYYGGDHGRGFYDDAAAPRPPASTFKPIALAAGLRRGIGYQSRWDGSSPRLFRDRNGVPLQNNKDMQCSNCTLQRAMVQSLNTPFYALAEQIGPERIRRMAIDLGISARYAGHPSLVDVKGDPRPGRTRADIAIGRYPVSTADLTSVYATFAAGGVRSTRFFVQSAAGADGRVLWQAHANRKRVLAKAAAADVSTVLRAAVDARHAAPSRPAAGKTGTQQWGNTRDNQDAWMAGYTPQLAATVWLGRSVPGPIRDSTGRAIEGETVPAKLWRDFLTQALKNQPRIPFPAPAKVGRTDVGDAGRSHGTDPDALHGSATAVAAQGHQPVLYTAHAGKRLALTFDDGPSDYTPEVLDLLARYHVKATFCVVGENVRQYPSLVRRIIADGHALCNHSLHHDDLGRASTARITDDLTATDAAIAAAAPGATVPYFRAPYGSWGASSEVAAGLGHTPLGWVVDPDDWTLPGVDTIVSRITAQLIPRAVVLVHDGGGERRQTVDALRILIPRLQHDGWTFDRPRTTVRSHPLRPSAPSPTPTPSPSDPTPKVSPTATAPRTADPTGSPTPSTRPEPTATGPTPSTTPTGDRHRRS